MQHQLLTTSSVFDVKNGNDKSNVWCVIHYFPRTEEETDDEDDEPKLKYQRLGASIAEILQDRAATCLAVAGKVRVCLSIIYPNSLQQNTSNLYICFNLFFF